MTVMTSENGIYFTKNTVLVDTLCSSRFLRHHHNVSEQGVIVLVLHKCIIIVLYNSINFFLVPLLYLLVHRGYDGASENPTHPP